MGVGKSLIASLTPATGVVVLSPPKLQRKVTQIMTNADALEKSQRTGSYPMTMSPKEFTAFMHREADRWAKVLTELNLRYD